MKLNNGRRHFHYCEVMWDVSGGLPCVLAEYPGLGGHGEGEGFGLFVNWPWSGPLTIVLVPWR